jgi:hypothetical protein
MVGGFQAMEATNRGGWRDSPPGASRSFGAHLPSGTDDLLLRARGGEIMTDPSSSWPVGAGSTRYRPPVHLAGLVITKLGRGSVAPGEVAGHPLLDCSIGGVWLCRTRSVPGCAIRVRGELPGRVAHVRYRTATPFRMAAERGSRPVRDSTAHGSGPKGPHDVEHPPTR